MSSITSEEVNYLIWKYLGDEGLDLTRLAFDEEAHVSSSVDQKANTRTEVDLVHLLLKGVTLIELEKKFARQVETGTAVASGLLADSYSPIKSSGSGSGSAGSASGAPKENSQPLSPTAETATAATNSSNERRTWPNSGDQTQVDTVFDPRNPSWSSLSPGTCVTAVPGTIALGTARQDSMLVKNDGTIIPLKYSVDNSDADVTALAWDSTASTIAVGSYTGGIRLWDSYGKLERVLKHHTAPVLGLKWSPDGALLSSWDCTNATAIWDVKNGELKRTTGQAVEELGALADMEWIDSKTYATSLGTLISVQGVAETVPHSWFRGHQRPINTIVFDQISQLLASGGDDHSIKVWHGKTQSPIRTLTKHTGPVIQLRWLEGDLAKSLDSAVISSRLMSGATDGTVILWDLNTSEPIWTIEASSTVVTLEISPDYRFAAFGSSFLDIYSLTGSEPERLATIPPPAGIQGLTWEGHRLVVATETGTAIIDVTDLAE